jgi:hypothetical protein
MTAESRVDTASHLLAKEWERTALGASSRWPLSPLRYVDLIMRLPTPAVVFWGPQQTQIYNDAYAVIMGPRHPRYFGEPYAACWPDTYPVIYPWMKEVLRGGTGTSRGRRSR